MKSHRYIPILAFFLLIGNFVTAKSHPTAYERLYNSSTTAQAFVYIDADTPDLSDSLVDAALLSSSRPSLFRRIVEIAHSACANKGKLSQLENCLPARAPPPSQRFL